jgi:hypothetical protein
MLGVEVTPARRRTWPIIAILGLVLVGLGVVAALMLGPERDDTVVPIFVPTLVTPVARDARLDEPIEYVAAASDAPVIAVASGHQIWISSDDGKTFARALQDAGAELFALSVDPSGRVYAMWGENKRWRSPDGGGGVDTIEFALGVAERDGSEHWRPMNESIEAPLDTRAGFIVGAGATLIGRNGGESWTGVPSSSSWHVWRASIDDLHTARFFASRIDAPESCEDCGRGFSLLVAREGGHLKPVWSMLDRTAIYTDDFPTNVVACAGFAGSTLYVVARDPHGLHLIAVAGDGKVLKKRDSLGEGLGADTTCTIAGNDRAAYMTLGDDMIRIDTEDLRVAPPATLTPRLADDRDELAVDEHGYLLYVADACVWRYTEDGVRNRHAVVCGRHR